MQSSWRLLLSPRLGNAAAMAPLPELIVANPYNVTPAGVYSPHVQSTIQHHERRVREHYRQHHQYKYKHN